MNANRPCDTFYNNSRTTHLSVEAEGQATDGTLLWGKTE